MKTQIALACLVAIVIVATVAAYDSLEPITQGSAIKEFHQGLQEATASRTKVSLIADGREYGGVPTNITETTVTLQGADEHERLLMRLDRIDGLTLTNSDEQQQVAEQVWDAAQTKSHLSSWATAKLSGTVTLNGKPLQGVETRFYFTENFSPAMTDEDGRYSLYVKRGLEDLGETRVRFYWPKRMEGPTEIPERYGRGSLLTADVRAGENVFNFDLQSD